MPFASAHITLSQKTVLRNFHCGENPLDIFDSYAMLNGVKVHCCRRWFGQSEKGVGEPFNSRVIVRSEETGYGDDPRLFIHQGRLCTVATVWSGRHDFRNHLQIFESDGSYTRYYLMPPKGLKPGKNWSPFEFPDGKLGFIHSFSPLVVLREIKREEGILLLDILTGNGIPREDGPNSYSAFRGGSNALPLDSYGYILFGIGHTTRLAYTADQQPVIIPNNMYENSHQLIHRPFGWILDFTTMTMHHIPVRADWDAPFWIVDPTSLIAKGPRKFELYTAEVERNFSDPFSKARSVAYEAQLHLS